MMFINNGKEEQGDKKKAQTQNDNMKSAKRKTPKTKGASHSTSTTSVVSPPNEGSVNNNVVSTDDDSGISSVDVPVENKQLSLPTQERLLGTDTTFITVHFVNHHRL